MQMWHCVVKYTVLFVDMGWIVDWVMGLMKPDGLFDTVLRYRYGSMGCLITNRVLDVLLGIRHCSMDVGEEENWGGGHLFESFCGD